MKPPCARPPGPSSSIPACDCFPASQQVVSEAATVRAGLGSMRNSIQSHWGPVGTATAPPQEEYQSPPPPDKHAISGGLKGASAAEPMDDDGDSLVRTFSRCFCFHLFSWDIQPSLAPWGCVYVYRA